MKKLDLRITVGDYRSRQRSILGIHSIIHIKICYHGPFWAGLLYPIERVIVYQCIVYYYVLNVRFFNNELN